MIINLQYMLDSKARELIMNQQGLISQLQPFSGFLPCGFSHVFPMEIPWWIPWRLPKGGILSQSLHSGGQVDPSGVACTVLVKKNVEKYVKYSDSICGLYIYII